LFAVALLGRNWVPLQGFEGFLPQPDLQFIKDWY